MTSEEELKAYMGNLDRRIKGIEERKERMGENYRKANP